MSKPLVDRLLYPKIWKPIFEINISIPFLIIRSLPKDLRPHPTSPLAAGAVPAQGIPRSDSTTEFCPTGEDKEVEYFFASDASAVIEHTNRVIFLEDDDVAAVKEGSEFYLGYKLYRII